MRQRGRSVGVCARWMAVVVTLAVAAACGAAPGPEGAQPGTTGAPVDRGRDVVVEAPTIEGGALVVAVGAETNGWTPQYSQFADAGHVVAGSMFDPLAIYDERGEPQPWLLESWTANDDLTEWRLTAKPGIRFHNGEPFDAAAMRANFQARVDSPLTGSVQRPLFREFVEDPGDPLTLIVRTTFSWATFPHALTGQPNLMAAPEQLADPDAGAKHPIGTGPYRFRDWTPGDRLTVVPFDGYWGGIEGAPFLDELEFRVIVDPDARNNALLAGDVDLILSNSPGTSSTFRDRADFRVIEDNGSEEVLVVLNESRAPFDDRNARAALASGTDVEAIVQLLGDGVTRPVTSPYPSEDDPWHVDDDRYPGYDRERARAFVEAYELEHGGPLSFTLNGVNNPDDLALFQVLAAQWAEIGIEARIETLEQSAFILGLVSADYDASWFRMFGATDPTGNIAFWDADNAKAADQADGISINFSQTTDPELDQLVDTIQRGRTFDERKAASDRAVQVLNEELPYVWLYSTPYVLAFDPRVGGLNPPRELGFGNVEPKWWVGGLRLVER